MSPLRIEAMKLRLAGHSYNEIHATLGVPKSTMNGWFRHIVLSDKAVARLKARTLQGTIHAFVKRNKLQTHHAEVRARQAHGLGEGRINSLTAHDLMVIGTALYWAEGYKRLQVRDGKERMSHVVRFVNSDSDMIRVFIRFLYEVLGVDIKEITASMRLYSHINEEAAYRYWMQVTKLPRTQFRHTTYLISGASKGTRPRNRLPWGTLAIQVSNTQKFHHLLGMIEGVKSRL